MKIPEGLSCPVTPEQAYFPHPVPSVPNNWEVHAFVVPTMPYQADEGYLDERGNIINATQYPQLLPRLIVRRKPEPKPKPARRFEFLDSSGILNTRSLYWCVPQELLREVKPITRDQVMELCRWYEGGGSGGMVAGLRELGIEVED